MSGFNEIQNPPKRYNVIDMPGLLNLCGFPDPEQFSEQFRQWVHEAISNGKDQRESCWTETVAVGSIGFVEEAKTRLALREWGEESKSKKLTAVC